MIGYSISRKSLVICILLTIVLLGSLWLGVSQFQFSSEPMSRDEAANAFQRLLLTLRRYQQLYPELPPFISQSEGDARLSWRILMLQDQLGAEWESIVQSDWTVLRSQLQGHPVDSCRRFFSLTKPLSAIQRVFGDDAATTKVMALVGPDSAFDHVGAGAKLGDMPPDLIVLLEMSGTDCHWMQPGDVHIDSFADLWDTKKGMRVGGNYENGFFVGFADGAVWFIDNSVPLERLMTFFTAEGATTSDRDALLGDFAIKRYAPLESN